MFLFSRNTALASFFGSLFHLGIMDPDSKSAASWGDASKGQQRQPVEEAVGPRLVAELYPIVAIIRYFF